MWGGWCRSWSEVGAGKIKGEMTTEKDGGHLIISCKEITQEESRGHLARSYSLPTSRQEIVPPSTVRPLLALQGGAQRSD